MLGRRIERLFFAGVLIILVCCIELYFVTASQIFSSERPSAENQSILNQIERNLDILTKLYEAKPAKQIDQAPPRGQTRKVDPKVLETRKALGLPPPTPEEPFGWKGKMPKQETYVDRMNDLINRAAIDARAAPGAIAKLVDLKKGPQENTAAIRQRLAQVQTMPVSVWGIETPRLLSLQYGGLDYKIPADFIANALLVALAPILVGWMGSFLVTRKRELLLISELDDFKTTFPHILNLVPVNWERIETRLGIYHKPRERLASRFLGKIFLLLFRWLVLLLFFVPMGSVYAYAAKTLWIVSGSELDYHFWVPAILLLVMIIQSINAFSQEHVFLKGKEFLA